MRMTCRQVMALLLALVFLLSLCGCGQMRQARLEQLGISFDKEDGESKDAKESQLTTSQISFKRPGTQSGSESLYRLRQQMQFPELLMGVAYLGYIDPIPTGQNAQWLPNFNRIMAEKYPFMTELDATHIIGSGGNLYCIVPLDEQATLTINRVARDGMTGASKVTQVLYQSESGEPLLLFDSSNTGTGTGLQIKITNSNGRTGEWEPLLDEEGCLLPCQDQKGNNILFDFSEYGWVQAPDRIADWLRDGWEGPTALGLAGSPGKRMGGNYWYVHTTNQDIGQEGIFYLWLQYRDDTGGTLMLNWISDDGGTEEVWNGYWTIETAMDAPSLLRVTVSLDDNLYGVFLSEIYPILISPSGLELILGPGENGIDMPCLAPLTVDGPCTLTLLDGSLG